LNLNPLKKKYLAPVDLWNLFHVRGTSFNSNELAELMAHFDFDCDGKIFYLQFMYELLDLPLPKAIRDSLPWARRGPGTDKPRPPLGSNSPLAASASLPSPNP
jgi:hypothetical protein